MNLSTIANTYSARAYHLDKPERESGTTADDDRKKCRLLLVEDNPLEARLFYRALNDAWTRSRIRLKFEIIHAERIEQACQILEQQTIDIVLLDTTLPDVPSSKNIERIRKTSKTVPIILMTGVDDAEILADAYRRGANDCLIKNRYDGVHLARTIGHAVERQEWLAELKRQSEEFLRRESDSRGILSAAFDGMIILDGENKIQFINSAAERILGYSAADQLGQTFPFDLTEDTPIEVDIVNRNGAASTLQMSLSPLPWQDQTARLVTLRDISALRKIENEKLQLERRLLESQRLESLGVMATSIVHDFNNLLTAILGNTAGARMELPETSPLQEDLTQIENSCQRASDLCQQMLAYSGGKSSDTFSSIDLNALIQETSTLLRHSISKRVQVNHQFGTAIPNVLGDETQLRQIIMNLVINASEAIGGKNGRIRLSTEVAEFTAEQIKSDFPALSTQPGRYIMLTVSDTGCGISPEVQAKIFDPFFSTKNSGRGVGLCAVAQIIKKHNGAITVSSQLNHGTTFRVLFPCATAEKRLPVIEPTHATSWRGHGTVLIIDDEKGVRSALSRILKHMGFSTFLAQDGHEGIAKFRLHADEITHVVLDLTMPKMDGEETCTELLKLRASVPIILMSGFNEDDACRRFADKGLAGFLQKPFNRDKLEKVFRSLTESQKIAA